MASGLLEKLLSLLGPSNDPEAVKKRRLKQIAKELSKNRYSRFYRVKTGEIDGSLGKLFFDIYKIVSSAQVFLQNAPKSALLKQIIVESFFDRNMEEIRQRLTPEAIEEKLKVNAEDLNKSLTADFNELSSLFDQGRSEKIDRCYCNILAMAQFVAFDFFYILKRFDSKITERNFTYQPKFGSIRGEYLSEGLKDFLEASFCLDPDQDWKIAVAAVKTYKNGVDVVVYEQWNKLLLLLREIKRSGMIELMIQHIDQKPDWVMKPKFIDEHITDSYLEIKRAEVKTAIDKALNFQKNARIGTLANSVFGSTAVNRTKFYTEKNGEIFLKKNFEGFKYSDAINYLKAFMVDYLKKDLRELYELLLIRGHWTDLELSRHTSEHLHKLMQIADKVVAFDESLADTGENGSRLKTSIGKVDRDKNQARYVSVILKNINDQAMELIKASALSLVVIGKSMKMLSDDYQRPSHELLINWKVLDGVSETPLKQRMANAYKKIYYFVQLIQIFSGSSAGEKGMET